MTPTELLLQQQLEIQAQELARLGAIVLCLQEKLDKWANSQRSAYAQLVGGSEDYLDTYYDKSLLTKRWQATMRIP